MKHLFWFLIALSTWGLGAETQPGVVLWRYHAGTRIATPPVLAADGSVYVGTGPSLNAVTNFGGTASNRWSFAPPGGVGPSAVADDGTIYCGTAIPSSSVHLYALRPDGSQKWVFALQFEYQIKFQSSPAIGGDNTAYFVAGGRLYAVNASGAKQWDFAIDDHSRYDDLSPVIGADGTIYVGSSLARTLYALTPQGTLKWSFNNLNSIGGESPAIGAAGTVYSTAKGLYAFSRDGSNLWFTTEGLLEGPLALGPNGTIYVANFGGEELSAISPAGELSWTVLGGTGYKPPASAPAVDASGRIYYCISNSVWALNSRGEVQWRISEPGDPGPGGDFAFLSPVIGPDGTLYAALGSTLYAIATGTNGPADSPWPMYRGNARHTGRVEKPALSQPKKRADANLEFQLFPHQLGLTYDIQNSTNLATWTSLTSIVAQAFPVDIVDLTATNSTMKFYRAVSGQ